MIGRRKSTPSEPSPPTEPRPGAKGRPTPKRSEAQARNRRPLVANDRKEARRVARERRNEAWARQREAMATGNEKYLPLRDKGSVRRYVRNHVDARWSVAEFFLPMALAMIVVMLFAGQFPEIASFLVLIVYAVLLVAIADSLFMVWRLKKKLVARFGEGAIPRWTGLYAFSRSFYFRRMRQPRPQVARGEFPG